MHAYATNFPWHPKLIFWLTVVAMGASAVIGWFAAKAEGWLGVSIGGVSAAATFTFLYFLFDKFLWKHRWVRSLLLVPDLNGEWMCAGQTLVKNGQDASFDWQAEICIVQSWSRLSITLKTSQSTSRSIAASLYHEHGEGYRLIYHYDNAPEVDQPRDLQRHTGLCNLLFDKNITRATGRYFTDRDRMTVGTMTLRRKGTPNEKV